MFENHPYQPIFERLDAIDHRIEKALAAGLNDHGLNQFEYVRVEKAAEILGVSIPTIRLYTSARKLRHYKRGHYVYYKIQDLNDFIEKGLIEASARYSKNK